MSVINLQVHGHMLDHNFESYKLCLDPIPVLKQPVVDDIQVVELGNKDYGFLQTRMALMHNYLFQDLWSQNSVFYVNSKNNVLWTSLGEDGRLTVPRCVWSVPLDAEECRSNITISFPTADLALLCDGKKNLCVLYSPSRDAGEPWMLCNSFKLEFNASGYLLHAVHRSTPTSQQIDCVMATVEHKSKLPENLSFQECHTFISVLEWLSLTCGKNNQVWTIKQTRRLAGPSFPEYAAIDNIGDAICVVSESDFKLYFDSDGGVILPPSSEIGQKYSYFQTPDEVIVEFKLPENIRKQDIQVNFLPGHLECLIQGKCILSGLLANRVVHEECTWTFSASGLRLKLFKAEVGLMWKELVIGNKDGEEIVDAGDIAQFQELRSQLQNFSSEIESLSNFNLDQLEECDSSHEELAFQVIDGKEHCETKRIKFVDFQWLFVNQTCPESLPTICLRHSFDGLLWQPKNVSSEGTMEHFRMEYQDRFPALGYVQASKREKKFISCSPDFHFSVISDCHRHLYIYCKPESLPSTLQLRNRITGESISCVAKQYVTSLEDCGSILGLQVSPQCIFTLSKDTLYAVKVPLK